jgi:hypothetical protein
VNQSLLNWVPCRFSWGDVMQAEFSIGLSAYLQPLKHFDGFFSTIWIS